MNVNRSWGAHFFSLSTYVKCVCFMTMNNSRAGPNKAVFPLYCVYEFNIMTDGQTASILPFICLDQVIQSRSCLLIVLIPLANPARLWDFPEMRIRKGSEVVYAAANPTSDNLTFRSRRSPPHPLIRLERPDRLVLLQHMFIIHNKFLFGWRHNWYVSQWLSMPSALLPLTFWSNRSQNRHAQNHTLVSRPQPGQLHHGQDK